MSVEVTTTSALHAFGMDVSYALAMIRQARIIQNKRDLWATRKALKQAERQSQARCAFSPKDSPCEERGPCGTGTCRFAMGELKAFHAHESVGEHTRPIPSRYPTYDPERSVLSLKEHLFGVSQV